MASQAYRCAVRVALIAAALAACAKGLPAKTEIARARARAEVGARRLMETLFAELTRALEAGPTEHALEVCGAKAQELTGAIEAETGVSVRRTALRVRNPQNAPDAYERAWLERAAAGGEVAAGAEVVRAEDGTYELRYLRPIRLAEMCTRCHGTAAQISPAVRDLLQRRYPSDAATGFAPGDLRGAVSVRVPFD
ncbi:MAG: Tll0287-like domain-containing protein [Planctomycetota bacterium]|jgi:hypothetical protein